MAGLSEPKAEGSRRGALLKLAALAGLVVVGLLAARLTPLAEFTTREGIAQVVEGSRGSTWAPLLFVVVYALATALAMPGAILTLAGGALFGVFWGSVYNTIAANLGANLAFLLSRYLGRDGIERVAGDRLNRLDTATREHGFRGLLTLRLIPLVPFNALNFGSGLTAMRWPTYAMATLIGILPGTLVYTNFADALLVGSQEASRDALVRVLLSGGLLVLLTFLPTLLRKANIRLPGSAAAMFWACLFLPFGIRGAPAPTPQEPPSAELQERSTLADPARLDAVLSSVVTPEGVDYLRLTGAPEELDAYLRTIAAVDSAALRSSSRGARLAFWINAYNACMLRLVVDHYPIRKRSGLFSALRNVVRSYPANSVRQIEDVFTREHCTVAGRDRSQDEIEHEILRPMGEPRIHFAINCAARSCPPLATKAYREETLSEQLDMAVTRVLGDPRHFSLTPETSDSRSTLRLNKVLDWFQEDFGGKEGIKAFLEPYLDPPARNLLRDAQIRFFDYDWSLNDIER